MARTAMNLTAVQLQQVGSAVQHFQSLSLVYLAGNFDRLDNVLAGLQQLRPLLLLLSENARQLQIPIPIEVLDFAAKKAPPGMGYGVEVARLSIFVSTFLTSILLKGLAAATLSSNRPYR